MDWVPEADYRTALPDPLADAAGGIITHMNQDHADALVTYARVLGAEPVPGATEATMTSVDRLGFKLRVRVDDRLGSVRIPFPREVRTASDARVVLIEMLRDARARESR